MSKKTPKRLAYALPYLADWRLHREMKQRQLADAVTTQRNTKTDRSTIARIEIGKFRASPEMRTAIAATLGISIEQLMQSPPEA